jgi:hypothetical protein
MVSSTSRPSQHNAATLMDKHSGEGRELREGEEVETCRFQATLTTPRHFHQAKPIDVWQTPTLGHTVRNPRRQRAAVVRAPVALGFVVRGL